MLEIVVENCSASICLESKTVEAEGRRRGRERCQQSMGWAAAIKVQNDMHLAGERQANLLLWAYFQELAHTIVGAGKSEIGRVGRKVRQELTLEAEFLLLQ